MEDVHTLVSILEHSTVVRRLILSSMWLVVLKFNTGIASMFNMYLRML